LNKLFIHKLLRPKGKVSFIEKLPKNAKILDVGCGNASPYHTKRQRPDLVYYGIDISNYNQQEPERYADRYIITPPENFAVAIEEMEGTFDAVISAHNLEHCDDPARVCSAMMKSLKFGGSLYLAFPCEKSISFPKREGTLNFYDDPSHNYLPKYDHIIYSILANGGCIDFSADRYRPVFGFLAGLILEPFGAILKRNMPYASTWALYGFETIIWATRRA